MAYTTRPTRRPQLLSWSRPCTGSLPSMCEWTPPQGRNRGQNSGTIAGCPTDVQNWLLEQAAIPSRVQYEHRWGPNFGRGLGLPLDWFTSDQYRHLVANLMRNLPTMTVSAERSKREKRLRETCSYAHRVCRGGKPGDSWAPMGVPRAVP